MSSINLGSILIFASCVIHLPLVWPADDVRVKITANGRKKNANTILATCRHDLLCVGFVRKIEQTRRDESRSAVIELMSYSATALYIAG